MRGSGTARKIDRALGTAVAVIDTRATKEQQGDREQKCIIVNGHVSRLLILRNPHYIPQRPKWQHIRYPLLTRKQHD
jgi:hypothetical protein